MLNTILVALLSFSIFFGGGSGNLLNGINQKNRTDNTGTLEKMIVANGSVAMDLNLNWFNGADSDARTSNSGTLRFDVKRNSFLTVMAFNGELRGALPGAMELVPQNSATLPAKLNASIQNLVFERTDWGEHYEFIIRDGKSGFIFFNVEGHEFNYLPNMHSLGIQNGRLLLSDEFAAEIGRPSEAGSVIGQISVNAAMRPIEVTRVVEGEATANVLPAEGNPDAGSVPGPDVVVGDVVGLYQPSGSITGTQVGLAVGTDSCNFGTVDLNWFALPSNDHPVIPQNLYRMRGGANNDERFEQIGQSSVKHGFTALTQNLCGLGCNGVGGTRLGSGCSDPYSASLNAGPSLGSRAWINPFTGDYPRGDSATPPNNHTGHAHNGAGHRILTEISDLSTTQNAGATYYAEAQYITPHEYNWCQTNPTQCNMYNNVSYRRYNVIGTGSPFSFSPVGATVRTKAAISAWTGATLVDVKPAPGVDGVGILGYKVSNPSAGVWHYEYALYNQNIDRGIQSFSVPTGAATLSNVGFYAPPQHPGSTGDGTAESRGFSSAAWTQTQSGGTMTWSSETLAQNPNANAIRWGTMYNFRFDSNLPPQTVNATVGFYKTGEPITVQVQAPSAPVATASAGGRVVSSTGRGVSNAWVSISDRQNGTLTRVMTNPFGYYNLGGIAVGGTYTISVYSKRYTFASQTLQINGNVQGVNFVAVQP